MHQKFRRKVTRPLQYYYTIGDSLNPPINMLHYGCNHFIGLTENPDFIDEMEELKEDIGLIDDL